MKPYIAHIVRYRRGRLYRAVDYATCLEAARWINRHMAQVMDDPEYDSVSALEIQEHRGGKPRRWG